MCADLISETDVWTGTLIGELRNVYHGNQNYEVIMSYNFSAPMDEDALDALLTEVSEATRDEKLVEEDDSLSDS